MADKYKAGDRVHAKANPNMPLVVRRFLDQIYYCRKAGDPDGKDLVFFERELSSGTTYPGKTE